MGDSTTQALSPAPSHPYHLAAAHNPHSSYPAEPTSNIVPLHTPLTPSSSSGSTAPNSASTTTPFPTVLWPLPDSRSTSEQPPLSLYYPLLQLAQLNNFNQKAFVRSARPTIVVSPKEDAAVALPTSDQSSKLSKKPQSKWRESRPQQQPDGNKSTTDPTVSDSLAMTSGAARDVPATMDSRKDDEASARPVPPHHRASSSRPAMISHHSNSVPSTPSQYPRSDLDARARTPSPTGDLGSHSPRSVVSESNGRMPTLPKTRQHICKYETSGAFGRRRIPYQGSPDILGPPPSTPKSSLNPAEEKKVTGDMRELYDRLLPTQESEERRRELVNKLEKIFKSAWPGNDFKVHVFGSSGNMLCTTDSDVDVCIQTPMKSLETMHSLADVLAKNGMERVVCVASAKVPIVKIWDPQLQLACDMNVNNTLALENTRLIKTYIQIDERVRPLAMIVKYWTKQRILNDAALGGTLSSYTWICMILNFLQTRDPPILPSLHKFPHGKKKGKSDPGADFADNLDLLEGYGKRNEETLGQLLFYFFRRYGYEIDFESSVISVREGGLITRKEKKWDAASLTKEGQNRLCVEEPFNTIRNLGNSADIYAWRGIHEELRQAFKHISDGHLDKACEQFEFPPEEKVTFKKPTPGPKPILQSAPTPGGRSRGPNARGGRNHQNANNGRGFRRASSAAAFGNGRPPFIQSPPIPTTSQDYFNLNQRNLHDQLLHQYQFLEMFKGHLVAQAHAHAQAQAQAQQRNSASGQNRSTSTSGSPQKLPLVNGQPPLDNGPATAPIMPQYLYQFPFYAAEPMAQSQSQDGSRTNPSSPSLSNATPTARRNPQRSSAMASGSPTSTRSQSQPARGMPSPLLPAGYPPPPNFDPSAFMMGYPQFAFAPQTPRQGQDLQVPLTAPLPGVGQSPLNSAAGGSSKEYVGYYVDQPTPVSGHMPPQSQQASQPPQVRDFSVPPIPSFQEIIDRRRKLSSELLQPNHVPHPRTSSRSPSPLGHLRGYSADPRSAPLPQGQFQSTERGEPAQEIRANSLGRDNGLLIVNGSYPSSASFPPTFDQESDSTATVTSQDSKRTTDRDRSGPVIVNGSGTGSIPNFVPSPNVPAPTGALNGHVDYLSGLSPKQKPQPTLRPSPTLPNGFHGAEDYSSNMSRHDDLKRNVVPVLSPVQETVTPPAVISQSNGILPGPAPSKLAKENLVTSGSERTQSLTQNVQPTGQQANPWQQSTSKKSARKKKQSKSAIEQKGQGEPLPTNEADRKGG